MSSLTVARAEIGIDANSNWQIQVGTGSYAGERQIGVAYQSENARHLSELSYGNTLGMHEKDIEQINLRYTYSPFTYAFHVGEQKVKTNIVGIGFQISKWLDDKAFFDSPSQYPEQFYYQQTMYRTALVFESRFQLKKAVFYVQSSLLDQWAIALYNNSELQSEKSIWATGIGLRWEI